MQESQTLSARCGGFGALAGLARVLYPLVFIAGLVVSQTRWDVELGPASFVEPAWLDPVAFGLPIGGYLLQNRFETSRRAASKQQLSRPYDASRDWRPAPGTNG